MTVTFYYRFVPHKIYKTWKYRGKEFYSGVFNRSVHRVQKLPKAVVDASEDWGGISDAAIALMQMPNVKKRRRSSKGIAGPASKKRKYLEMPNLKKRRRSDGAVLAPAFKKRKY